MTALLHIAAFYRFTPLTEPEVSELSSSLASFGTEKGMTGLVLLATEGINGTVCAPPEAMDEWKRLLADRFPGIGWNDSVADAHPFKSFQVEVRREIVNLDRPGASPVEGTHLTPEQWEEMLKEDVIVVDTRNDYETRLGAFENAVDPKLKTFRDFSGYVRSGALPKDKTIMMYCTGGIRCEKAAAEMKREGYEKVYQLKGGILNYLKRFPNGKFKGECFVFDQRVAVDGHLRPSARYDICPHCGDPGDVRVKCARCGENAVVCEACSRTAFRDTCSKNCRGILRRDTERSLARG